MNIKRLMSVLPVVVKHVSLMNIKIPNQITPFNTQSYKTHKSIKKIINNRKMIYDHQLIKYPFKSCYIKYHTIHQETHMNSKDLNEKNKS